MANDQMNFEFQGKTLRTVVIDGKPWFVAKDVCLILDIHNQKDAVSGFKGKEKQIVSITDYIGNRHGTLAISEAAVYELISKSRKEQAMEFREWMMEEVLLRLPRRLNRKESRVDDFSQRMSSREIAELLEKEHSDVFQEIKTLICQGPIDTPNFGVAEYTDTAGKLNLEYFLDSKAVMELISGYDAVLRAKVIRRWRELEEDEAKPSAHPPLLPSEIALRKFEALKGIAELCGLKGDEAVLAADNAMKRIYGPSPLGNYAD